MNKEQLLRLKGLLAKAEGDLTDAEKSELKQLKDLASQKSIDLTKLDDAIANAQTSKTGDGNGGDTIDEDGFKKLVGDTITKALTDAGLSIEQIRTELGDSLKNGVKMADIQLLIEKHAGTGVDMKALGDLVLKQVKEASKDGLTEARVKELFADAFKENTRRGSKMEHQEPNYELPFAHRAGNLTVGMKQLLNVLMNPGFVGKDEARVKMMNEGISDEQLRRAEASGEYLVRRAKHEAQYGTKGLTTTGSGTGAELMNTDLSSDLLSRMYMESPIASAFISQEVNMTSGTYQFPMNTTRPGFFVGSEGGSPDATTPGTRRPQLTAKKLIGMVDFSYEADEDSIVPVLPMLQAGLAAGAADALEGAIINGDADGTHQDSDIQAVARHHAKVWDGLRKYALAVGALKVSFASGNITVGNLKALRKALLRWGLKPNDLMLICGPMGYNDLVGLDETLTLEKVGAEARILTGNAPRIFGIPIIPSSQCREDLNASGVYDGSTVTKGSMILVYKPAWIMGVRRGFTVEIDVDKQKQLNYVIASFRRDFVPNETPSATVRLCSMAYNYNA